ncbi:LysM peptidoglycan-binding domain-containing protein [Enterococcus faecalis]|nr:LysM peptidoglycan-binding domain-containing protein [Enterococcus faecalis]
MKKKILISLSTAMLLGGLAVTTNTKVEAAEWVPNSPEMLNIESGQTSYTLVFGDTLWAISQRVNLTVQTLADMNNINLGTGEQYFLPVGRIIYFNGDKVTVKESNGNVVSETVVTDEQKVNPNQNVGETVDNLITEPNTNDNNSTEKPSNPSEGGDEGQTPVEPSNPGDSGNGGETPTEPSNPDDGGNTGGGETTDPGEGGETGGGEGENPGSEIPEGPYAGTIIPGENNGDVGTWTDKNAMMDYIENNWDAVSGGRNDYSMTTNGYGWIAMFY